MSDRAPAIVVIGATGYTGRLIAHELARGDDPVILAARDPRRLATVADEVGLGRTQTVDVTDPPSLEALIRPGDVVINTAGPFTELGEPVVRACVEAGAHYFDTTGEQPFMKAIRDRYHDRARAGGVTVVNAMAFEYALGDCAVAVAAEGAALPLRSLDAVYAWGGTRSSRGTRSTVLLMLGRRAWVRRDGRFRKRPPGAGHRSVTLASGRTLHAVGFGAGEIVTAPRYLDVREARGWLVMGSTAARLAPLLAPALPYVLPLLRPILRPIVTRPPDPTAEERDASRFTIRIELEAADGVRKAFEVQGRDPYGVTAAAAAYGARRALAGETPAGVLAPAQAVEPVAFLESLAPRGVRLVPDPGGS
ncbi:MAG: saccharopine dehydrogenase NADP-binding domain-containing protein [Longimicrobiales bacterium]|nr:saccharopine dehydrogenase NADP-binding domain-containing protein [Longimicrobiales bacterium]